MDNLKIDYETANYYKRVFGNSNEPNFEFKTKYGHSINQINEVIRKSLDILYSNIYSYLSGFTNDYRQNIVVYGEGSNLYNLVNYLGSQLNIRCTKFTPVSFGARRSEFTNLVSMIYYFETYQLKNYSRVSAVGFTRNSSFTSTQTTRTISIHSIEDDSTEKL